MNMVTSRFLRAATLTFCLAFGGGHVVPGADAAPVTIPPRGGDLPGTQYLPRGWQPERSLQQVVDLLQAGEREQARNALARILSREPQNAGALFLAGVVLLEDGKHAAARESFERVLALDSQLSGVREKLGVAQMLTGQLVQGAENLRQALAEDPELVLALRYLGWFSGMQGDIPAAIRYHEQLINLVDAGAGITDVDLDLARLYNRAERFEDSIALLEPRLGRVSNESRAVEVHLLLAQAKIRRGATNDAASHVRAVAQALGTEHPEVRLVQAELALARGAHANASEHLQALLDTAPEYRAAASFRLAQAHASGGNPSAAIAELDRTLALVEPDERVQVVAMLTGLLVEQGEAASALDVAAQQVREHPDHPALRLHHVQLLFHAGRFAEARAALQEAMQRHADFMPAVHLAGRLEWREGRHEAAQQYFNTVLERQPGALEVWVDLAGVQIAAGELKKGLASLEAALKANPGNTLLLFERASVLEELGDADQANKVYRAILDAEPGHVPALNNLAANMLKQDQVTEALPLAEAAWQQASDNPIVQNTYGWALLQSDNVQAALPLLQQAALGMPDDGNAHYRLGEAYRRSGQADKARQAFETALANGVDSATRSEIERHLR